MSLESACLEKSKGGSNGDLVFHQIGMGGMDDQVFLHAGDFGAIDRICQGFCVRAEIKQACALQTQLRIGLKRSSNLESAWSTF
jgi:hypothetical protein